MIFQQVESYPGDPILSLMDVFHQDKRVDKVNLIIGFYYDHEGQVPVLESVQAAKAQLDARPLEANLYLPMDGDPGYRSAVQRLLFGDLATVDGERIVTAQSVGGSGAIRIGADLLKRYYPNSEVWISDPSWDNHLAIFAGAGFELHRYPYLTASGTSVDFNSLLGTLEALPAYSIVLLHACCHNPTGTDLSPSQWDELFALFKARQIIPFIDAAYLGLGDGLEQDAYALRALARSGITGLVSNSFSKVFSLYGERVGSLSVVCESAAIAERVAGQLKGVVRASYANPPRFGAQLVTQILEDAVLHRQWHQELQGMHERLQAVRRALFDAIQHIQPDLDVRYLLEQKGMFSYTGLSAEQVDRMRAEHGVYLIHSGRACIAGLNTRNIQTVAQAFAAIAMSRSASTA